VSSSLAIDINKDYITKAAGTAGAVTAKQLNATADGKALLLALRQSIATQLGIKIEQVDLMGLTPVSGGGRRHLAEYKTAALAANTHACICLGGFT